MLWETHQLFAVFCGTVQKVEYKSWTGPLPANYSCNADEVENVFASVHLDAWFVLQTLRVAHLTVGVFFCVLCKLLMDQDTVLVKTGQTRVFIAKTLAGVVALKNLVAALLHQSLAIVIRANIHEGRAL